MKVIEFRGYSDDTFGFDVFNELKNPLSARDPGGECLRIRIGGDDHDDCANGTVRAYRVESTSTGTAVIVTGVYGKCPGATWSIGISPDDEDIAIPEWAARPHFRTDGYTPVMALTVPDDATVKLSRVDGNQPSEEPPS